MPPSRETHTRKSFRLITLGGAALVAPDGTPIAEQRRRVAVLVLVAAGGARGTSRDKLIATLSPDSTTDSARHALHQLLYYLRRQVGEDAFLGTDPLRLNTQLVAFDVEQFEEAIARGALTEAATLYRGPFLDGFHLGESAEFEEWASHERLRLAAKYADVLVRLAQEQEQHGDARGAAEWWRTLAGIDPLNAQSAVGLMRALAASGDRSGALRHGQQYQARVRLELDARPDARVAALLAELRAADADVSTAPEAGAEPAPVAPAVVGSSPWAVHLSERESRVAHPPASAAPPNVAPPPRPRSAAQRRRWHRWEAAGIGVGIAVAVLLSVRRDVPALEVPSLGVVPIVNTAGDSLDYLAEGIATSARDRLSQSRSLRVITVRDARAARGTAAGRAALGRRTGVSAVLSGTLTREQDTLWLTAELVRSADGVRLTSGRFAVATQRLVTVESDLLDSVAVALGLARVERHDRRPRDPEVRATLMRADYYFGKRDTTSFRKAFDLYRQAIDRDGGSAEAYAGLSSAFGAFAYYSMMPTATAYNSARAAAERALDLDPENSQAAANLAYEWGMRDWNWKKAESGLRDAVRLEPWRASTWMLLGTQMRVMGRFEDALVAYRKARELDPLARHYTYQIAHAFICAGEPDSALATLREAIALGSPYPAARYSAAAVLGSIARYDDAIEEWRIAAREAADSAALRALAGVRGREGYARIIRERAKVDLAGLTSRSSGSYVPRMQLAQAHALLGDTVRALDWLERASEERDPNISMIGCRSEYDALRHQPRFVGLLRKMHLTSATFGQRPVNAGATTLARARETTSGR